MDTARQVAVIEEYILRKKGVRVYIGLGQLDPMREMALVGRAYAVAVRDTEIWKDKENETGTDSNKR